MGLRTPKGGTHRPQGSLNQVPTLHEMSLEAWLGAFFRANSFSDSASAPGTPGYTQRPQSSAKFSFADCPREIPGGTGTGNDAFRTTSGKLLGATLLPSGAFALQCKAGEAGSPL